MKIVLDTNVLISALLKPRSKPAAVLRLIINGQVRIAYDTRILGEYQEVLKRPLFHFTPEQIDPLLDYFEQEGDLAVGSPLPKGLPDPTDEPFLEVAVSAHADAIVTGNKRHYPAAFSAGILILTPAEFLELFHINRTKS